MKIIILSASTGGGHITAANCVRDYLIKNGGDLTIPSLVNIFHFL